MRPRSLCPNRSNCPRKKPWETPICSSCLTDDNASVLGVSSEIKWSSVIITCSEHIKHRKVTAAFYPSPGFYALSRTYDVLLLLSQRKINKSTYCWNCPWRQSPLSHDCCPWHVLLPHPNHGPRTLCHLLRQGNWNIQKAWMSIRRNTSLIVLQYVHVVHTI